MTQRASRSWTTVLAIALLAGCAGKVDSTPTQAPAAAPVAPPGARLPGLAGPAAAPGPIQPLTAAPAPQSAWSNGAGGTSAAPAAPPPHDGADAANLTLKDLTVDGDPTRIVYPTPTLESGKLYPVLIFAHGHGMDQTQLTERTDLASAAAKEGWLSASGDFAGRAAWANDTALHDVGNLVTELVAHHQADPKRIYLVGFSMGGGTALLAAENPLGLSYRPAAVVSTQGFTDLKAMTLPEAGGGQYAADINLAYGGELTDTQAQGHSPIDLADKLRGIPVYLEHGEADTNVPVTHSIRMADALKALGAPPELHTYPGLTHGESTIHTQAIMDFLRGKSAP